MAGAQQDGPVQVAQRGAVPLLRHAQPRPLVVSLRVLRILRKHALHIQTCALGIAKVAARRGPSRKIAVRTLIALARAAMIWIPLASTLIAAAWLTLPVDRLWPEMRILGPVLLFVLPLAPLAATPLAVYRNRHVA